MQNSSDLGHFKTEFYDFSFLHDPTQQIALTVFALLLMYFFGAMMVITVRCSDKSFQNLKNIYSIIIYVFRVFGQKGDISEQKKFCLFILV